MDESMTEGIEEQQQITESAEAPQPRAVGSPLPMGNGARVQPPPTDDEIKQAPAAPPLGRSLSSPTTPAPQVTTLQRAVNVLRVALPFVQRMLPLLDGNIGTAVANILNPPPPPAPPPPPPVEVDLTPIQAGLAELRSQHRELHDQVAEQNISLKHVEDKLEAVREATDRNTLEQQELLEDLKSVGSKVNLVAIIALGLLSISILLNIALYLHIQRVLP